MHPSLSIQQERAYVVNVAIQEIHGLRLASLLARRGANSTLAATAAAVFNIDLPLTSRVAQHDGLAFVGSGPGHWLVVADPSRAAEDGDLETLLSLAFAGLATACEQTDSRVVLEVSGPAARATLAKGLPIDLHPRQLQPDDAVLCLAAHIGVQLWQTNNDPCYRLAVARSYAASLRRWLDKAAAEFAEVTRSSTAGQA